MRRGCVVTVIGVMFTLGAVVPAMADRSSDSSLNRFITGPASAIVTVQPPTADCAVPIISHLVYGAGQPPSKSGTADGPSCVDISTSPNTVSGPSQFRASNGAVLVGTLSGDVTFNTFDDIVTVTGGTKQFSHATGTVELIGTRIGFTNTFNVTLVPHLTRNVQG